MLRPDWTEPSLTIRDLGPTPQGSRLLAPGDGHNNSRCGRIRPPHRRHSTHSIDMGSLPARVPLTNLRLATFEVQHMR
jgi:hypothetical protein